MLMRILPALLLLVAGACSRPANKSQLAHDYGQLHDQPSRFEWFVVDENSLKEMDAEDRVVYYSATQ